MPSQLPLFIEVVLLCCVCWSCSIDAHYTGKKADEAFTLAYKQKLRLDRMNRQANVGSKETKFVDYEKGFDIRDSWVDDFSRTQGIRLPKPGLFRRVMNWFKDHI